MPYYNSSGQLMPESGPETGRVVGTSAGGETIQAPAGNTSVSGEGGGDLLIGSSGDNRFWITNRNDVVVEQPNAGVDTIIGWTSYRAPANVENLYIYNDFSYAYGNNLGNLIVLDDTTHWAYGAGGNDVIVGAAVQKTTFVVRAGEGSDVIYNWNGNSQLQLWGYGFTTAQQIRNAMTQVGADVVLRLNAAETLTFRGETLASFADRQFLLPLDRSQLGALTFSDEFNTLQIYDPSLETGIWRADFGGNLKDIWAYAIPSSGDRQVYAKPGFYGRGEADLDLAPHSVANGVLSITASRIPDANRYAAFGREYSSGLLNTYGAFEQKYGYFEMRAELPAAMGSWPAFWMIPHPYVAQVEADIFEALGATPYVDYRRAWGGAENIYDNGLKIDPTGFHTYGMLWTPTMTTFYFDDVAVMQAKTPSSWTEPMAMIINMTIGGWGGVPNAAHYPASMNVDYVRAYALPQGTIVERGEFEPPAATIRADGGLTSGHANVPVTFEADGQPVTTGKIAVYGAKPATLPPGKTFVIWEEAGAVFGAVSNGTTLATATPLMAGSSQVFTGTGSWLTDGRVALAYMRPDGAGQAAWTIIFDPATRTFTRHELGPSTGDIDVVATPNGGFAASWDASGGTVQGRGYDAFAYDGKGWYGPTRQLAGDLTGRASTGELISTLPGGAQQLYDVINPPPGVKAVVSVGPQAGVTLNEGNSGLTLFTFTVTRSYDLTQKSTVGWSVRGQGNTPANAADFQNGVLPSGVVTFEINQSTASIEVWVAGDTTIEATEQFLVTLANPVGAKLGDAIASGFIANDDSGGGQPPPPGGGQVIVSDGPGDTLVGGTGNDTLVASKGADVLTGGGGGDKFVWPAGTWGVARVTDFTIGMDSIDLSALFQAAGYAGSDPVADKYVSFTDDGAGGTKLLYDRDGAGGNPQWPSYIINLEQVPVAGLTWAKLTGGAPPPGAVIGFSTTSLTLNEGGSGVTAFAYTVTRTGSTAESSTVNWSVAGSGANPAAGSDFQGGALPSGTLSFAAGETAKTILVNVLGDTAVEPNEAFTVTLSNPGGASLGTATATGAITNDDGLPPPGGVVINSKGPGDTLVGGAGYDTLNASKGADVLTGGGGADHFVWPAGTWGIARVTDFAPGQDKIDLSALFDAAGYAGSDPFAAGYMRLISDGSGGTKVLFDPDAAGPNPQWPSYIIRLEGVAPNAVTLSDWIFQ